MILSNSITIQKYLISNIDPKNAHLIFSFLYKLLKSLCLWKPVKSTLKIKTKEIQASNINLGVQLMAVMIFELGILTKFIRNLLILWIKSEMRNKYAVLIKIHLQQLYRKFKLNIWTLKKSAGFNLMFLDNYRINQIW